MPGLREQTVLTPPSILDPLRSVWGEIICDPCAAPAGPLWIDCTACKGKGFKGRKLCRRCKAMGGAYYEDQVRAKYAIRQPDDGLAYLHPDRTFKNPPWGVLQPWLDHTALDGRQAWLVPSRSQRVWWRAWARQRDVVIDLNPVTFVGHHQSYPGPCSLGYDGADAQAVVDAFAALGSPR